MAANNIDKPMMPSEMKAGPNPNETDMGAMDIQLPEDWNTSETDDEGLELSLDDESQETVAASFDENIAERMPDDALLSMSTELVRFFDADKSARGDWEKSLAKGLELLGIKMEERTEPWQGASGVFHPVLAETAIQFQAHAIMELFPASGPARTTVFGDETPELLATAARVEQELNFQITQKMTEYRFETEQLLYRLAIAGSSFKKVYYDPNMKRPVSMFVPAEDFVAPYGASDLLTCERYTHVMKRTTNELKKSMKNGFYKKMELEEPTPDFSKVRGKIDKIVGEQPSIEINDRHTVLEMHVDLNLSDYDFVDSYNDDDFAVPYVITIDHQSQKVLAIRRNWDELDELKKKRVHFVHYQYLPGLGFYGTGLVHIIGGLAKSATSILRQMIDSGTLSNLPAGFKARGLRIKDDQSPIRPGEFRDVDVPGQSIKDGILPLPIKEPSSVLFSLLGNVVDEARRIGSVPDMDITDLQEGLPVGTTLAVLERSLKVMSAVQARMHAALRIELGLIADIVSQMEGSYEYGASDGYDRATDFGDRISIVPVSDPNAATMAQRVIQYQTVLQLASQQPLLYDMPKLHRTMLDYIGVKDAAKLVKMPEDQEPMDPVSENMAIITGKPVKAFMNQDHKSHIAVHLAAAQDPQIQQLVQQSPTAQTVMASMSAHVLEHVAMQYRQQIEQSMGVQLPERDAKLNPAIEAKLSPLLAQAAQKLLQASMSKAQQEKAQQAAQDPLVQIEQAKLQIEAGKQKLAEQKATTDIVMKSAEMKSRDELERLKIAADLAKNSQALQHQAGIKAADVMLDAGKELQSREHEAAMMDKQHQNSARDGHRKNQDAIAMETQRAQHKAVLDSQKGDQERQRAEYNANLNPKPVKKSDE
jgi:hypothetical protein